MKIKYKTLFRIFLADIIKNLSHKIKEMDHSADDHSYAYVRPLEVKVDIRGNVYSVLV